jgi:hypothetical protein
MGIFHGVDEDLAEDQHNRLDVAHQHHAIAATMGDPHLLLGEEKACTSALVTSCKCGFRLMMPSCRHATECDEAG